MPLAGSVGLGLLAMIGYGVATTLAQPLSRVYSPERLLFVRGAVMSVLLVGVGAPVLRVAPPEAVVAVLALGAAGYLPVLVFTHGLRVGQLGIVAPIAGTAPLVTVLLSAVFLSVPVRPVQWFAVVVVVVANVSVSAGRRGARRARARRPDPPGARAGLADAGLAAGRAGGTGQGAAAAGSRGVPHAVFATLSWGVYFVFLVRATQAAGPWLAAWLIEVGVTLAAGVHLWLARVRVAPVLFLRPAVVLNAVLNAAGTVAYTVGVRYGNPAVVAALTNSNGLVATLLAGLVFRERLTPVERLCAVLMTVGVVLIAVP